MTTVGLDYQNSSDNWLCIKCKDSSTLWIASDILKSGSMTSNKTNKKQTKNSTSFIRLMHMTTTTPVFSAAVDQRDFIRAYIPIYRCYNRRVMLTFLNMTSALSTLNFRAGSKHSMVIKQITGDSLFLLNIVHKIILKYDLSVCLSPSPPSLSMCVCTCLPICLSKWNTSSIRTVTQMFRSSISHRLYQRDI